MKQRRAVEIFIPDMDVYAGILEMLRGTEGGFETVFSLEAKPYGDGIIYHKNGVRVIALHNSHLGPSERMKSFSFRIEAGSKSIVYSGDVASIADFEEIMDHCDLLLMETGHNELEDVCRDLKTSGKSFGRLVFIHHGRTIMQNPAAALARARELLGDKVLIADDGMTLTV